MDGQRWETVRTPSVRDGIAKLENTPLWRRAQLPHGVVMQWFTAAALKRAVLRGGQAESGLPSRPLVVSVELIGPGTPRAAARD